MKPIVATSSEGGWSVRAARPLRRARTRSRLLIAALAAVLVWVSAPAVAEPGHDHEAGCAEDNAVVVELRSDVAAVLSSAYSNLASVLAAGFIPYFDAVVPYGNTTPWPAGIETGLPYFDKGGPDPQTWVKHYIQPDWMNDGDNLNPLKPESILLDEWDRPIGVMFIADLDTPGDNLYVNPDGTACHPWHAHVDDAAIYAFWAYRYFYEGNPERPTETPPMMHVWVDNSLGTFAHEYPPADERQGPPPPTPYSCTPSMEQGPAGAICR